MHLPTALGAVVSGALLVAAAATPAEARPPLVDLRGAAAGSYALDDAGTAHLTGSVVGEPFSGEYTATLAADDGSLPGPGTCEPATATLQVTGPRDRHLELPATGEVCGEWSGPTYVVTHDFTGRYEVTDAWPKRLRGTDGWIGVVLATDARADVEAFDS